MIVAGSSFSGKLKIHRVAKITKVNFNYNQTNVLKKKIVMTYLVIGMVERQIRSACIKTKHRLIVLFLQQMEKESDIRHFFHIHSSEMPDASPMDIAPLIS